MDGISELARLFKERDNKPYMGPIVGNVVSPLPDIKIQIDNNIILNISNLVISNHTYMHYKNIDDTWLVIGDKVILIPSTDEQTYFLIDKAVIL